MDLLLVCDAPMKQLTIDVSKASSYYDKKLIQYTVNLFHELYHLSFNTFRRWYIPFYIVSFLIDKIDH